VIDDPFKLPVGIETDGTSDMDRRLKAAIPPGTWRETVLLGTRTTRPSSVKRSIVGPPCALCGTRVWLSPSSQKIDLARVVVVCLECAVRVS